MDETLKDILLESEQDQGDEEKLKTMSKARYEEARKIKQKRVGQLSFIKRFLERLTDTVNTVSNYGVSGSLDKVGFDQKFISPIPTTIIEKKCSSDWVPDLTFEPEERFGEGADVYLARNSNRVMSFGLKVGKFRKACQDGSQDLFEKGRMPLQMGFMTRTDTSESEDDDDETKENREYQKATFIRIRSKKWESVYWTKDEHTIFVIEEFSLAECIEIFGDEVKNFKLKDGDLYNTLGDELDYNKEEDLRKTVQVAHMYCDTEKVYTCQIGGADNFYKKMTGKRYPFTDEWGDGYIPIEFIDASSIKRDGHPISDLDKILPICVNYDQLFQAVIRKAKKSSRSKDIIGSTNPKNQRLEYLQDEANDAAGLDVPHFMKVEEGTQLFAKTLDTPFDLNSPLAIRDAFIDEIMMTTGVNLRLLGGGAETARQEELRIRRELEVIDEMIKVNEPRWESFALKYMQMLKNVEADFYDEYIAIEDELSEKNGIPVDGTVRDIISNLDGFPFNVKVSVNQSNSKRKALEISQKEAALNTIAPFAQGSIAVARMAYSIAEDKFQGMKFSEEDFLPQVQPQPSPAGGQAPSLAGGPMGNPAQQLNPLANV